MRICEQPLLVEARVGAAEGAAVVEARVGDKDGVSLPKWKSEQEHIYRNHNQKWAHQRDRCGYRLDCCYKRAPRRALQTTYQMWDEK